MGWEGCHVSVIKHFAEDRKMKDESILKLPKKKIYDLHIHGFILISILAKYSVLQKTYAL